MPEILSLFLSLLVSRPGSVSGPDADNDYTADGVGSSIGGADVKGSSQRKGEQVHLHRRGSRWSLFGWNFSWPWSNSPTGTKRSYQQLENEGAPAASENNHAAPTGGDGGGNVMASSPMRRSTHRRRHQRDSAVPTSGDVEDSWDSNWLCMPKSPAATGESKGKTGSKKTKKTKKSELPPVVAANQQKMALRKARKQERKARHAAELKAAIESYLFSPAGIPVFAGDEKASDGPTQRHKQSLDGGGRSGGGAVDANTSSTDNHEFRTYVDICGWELPETIDLTLTTAAAAAAAATTIKAVERTHSAKEKTLVAATVGAPVPSSCETSTPETSATGTANGNEMPAAATKQKVQRSLFNLRKVAEEAAVHGLPPTIASMDAQNESTSASESTVAAAKVKAEYIFGKAIFRAALEGRVVAPATH